MFSATPQFVYDNAPQKMISTKVPGF